jgi:hypothetical protein
VLAYGYGYAKIRLKDEHMKSRRRKTRLSKPWLITLAVLAVVLVSAGAYSYFVSHKATTQTAGSKTSPSPSSSDLPMGGHGGNTAVDSGPSHDTTPTPAPTIASNPSHPVTAALAAPTETLNNDNGTISLQQCAASNSCSENSNCNSVSGAKCFIEASKDGTPTKTVSSVGTIPSTTDGVELIWNVNQLTPGSWIIQAVASYGGSQAISGPIPLTVTQ